MSAGGVDIVAIRDPVLHARAFAEVYHSALSTLPGAPDLAGAHAWSSAALPLHAGREAFRCYGAFAAGRLVGFIYGYHGARGQYWEDWLAPLMAPEIYARWIGDHYAVVEFHVHADRHGQGIGSRLYDRLFDEPLLYPHAVLTTRNGDTPARRFYARRGWTLVARLNERFSLLGRPLVNPGARPDGGPMREPELPTAPGSGVSPSGRSGARPGSG